MRLRANVAGAEHRVPRQSPLDRECVTLAVGRHILMEERRNTGDGQVLCPIHRCVGILRRGAERGDRLREPLPYILTAGRSYEGCRKQWRREARVIVTV